ncbi:hypothetical protein P7K49_010587 [Saguinus oedipus]|uniref:IF rod domain-containing protein n=1 Tax=Saguinus oedipus TaxID=9490 RepID=A0ABQ9VNY8_SAGOE|nr:hypothetical protein P7K49_010587 [Saguinus oedipus]
MMLTELRRTVQSLEIDLDSMRNTKISLENSLREVEARYALQMEQLNGILLHLDSNSMQTIQKTTICRTVDGKVVSETNDTKVLRH